MSRKFFLTIIVLALNTVLLLLKFIGEQTFSFTEITVLTLYFGGNITDKKLNGS